MASTHKTSWVTFGSIMNDTENSGTCTPPLWKTTHYGNLSPKSRSEAVERGQKELMEMVSKMPEGCYELSLRDIVEVQHQHQQEQEHKVTNKTKRSTETKKKRIVHRSGSNLNNQGGFLLKMMFPISWGGGSKKKKKNGSFRSNSVVSSSSRDGRVSPKPLLSEGSTRGGGDDKDWWIGRRFSESEISSGGFSSVNSRSSKSSGSSSSRCSSMNSSRIRHGNGGCWCFTFKTKE